jgi:hypothetical protein
VGLVGRPGRLGIEGQCDLHGVSVTFVRPVGCYAFGLRPRRAAANTWRAPIGNCATTGKLSNMYSAAAIIATIIVFIPLAIVGYVFIWAARKDGEEDKAVQARLGIRRRTRLGR